MKMIRAAAILTVGIAIVAAGQHSAARADVNAFTLRQPLDNATVRETVPVRIPRNLLTNAGYATITIDGQFRGAPAVPKTGDTIYLWDTKGTYETADKPDQVQSTTDGAHTILVDLFDAASNEIARASSTVRVANHITTLPDGVHMSYKWRPNIVEVYTVHDDLKNQDANAPVQSVDARFSRSVEDISPNGVLLRDHVLPNGQITGGASNQPVYIQTAYTIASKYWTVDQQGRLLTENSALGNGTHLGFPIVQLPVRRVGVGDSWQIPMMLSLPWSAEHLTTVQSVAKLDSFEWQSGHPTAKIIETYAGPADFELPPSNAGSGSAGGTVHVSNLHASRTIWFAYEAGIVVRIDTALTLGSAGIGSDQLASLQDFGSGTAAASGAAGGAPGAESSNSGMSLSAKIQAMEESGQEYIPGQPGGAQANGMPPQASQPSASNNLTSNESITLATVGSL